MKKILLLLAGAFLFGLSCNKSVSNEDNASVNDPAAAIQRCAAYEVLAQQLKDDPSLQGRMDAIEAFTQQYIKNPSAYVLSNGILTVPVVVNVLYKTTAQNISTAQIQSQIDVLNKDY